MARPILREHLAQGRFFAAPGIHDMMAAVIANKVGFPIVYGPGYWLTASRYGLPDAGIASYTQMLESMATLVRTVDSAVIADADTGYGGLLNVHHTVRGYEAAGVTAVQIEDQEFPKKCGHTPFRRVIPLGDMVEKVKVAVAARTDPNLVIVARTDARQAEGLARTLDRARAYAEAGADMVFVEALTSREEMAEACRTVGKPLLANMANGGVSPILTTTELEGLGYAGAIFPAMTSLAANAATEAALRSLKERGSSLDPSIPMFDFPEFCRLIGFDQVWAFERQWGPAEQEAAG